MRDEVKTSCLKRLKRIEGQIRGLATMVEEDRYCIDVVTQIAAARAALRRVEEEVLRDHVAHCVEHAISSGDKADQRRKITELMDVIGRADRASWRHSVAQELRPVVTGPGSRFACPGRRGKEQRPQVQRRPGLRRDDVEERSCLGIKSEMHHVAIGDDVVLAFEPQLAGIACAGFAVAGDIILIRDGLGADETLLEIGMDHAGGGRRLGAAVDGPGTRFLRADGEIGDEVEQPVAGADQAIEPG
ncbi:hypothetical protein chiPu_0028095, partial [Chiloscyllium punctatum]|nr:hypothetical protein [Chiloscyllium punctatum]